MIGCLGGSWAEIVFAARTRFFFLAVEMLFSSVARCYASLYVDTLDYHPIWRFAVRNVCVSGLGQL